jgi:Flp pilus assembly protein TadB
MVELDPKRRAELGQYARLWLLAIPCAAVGAYVVSRTNDLPLAVLAFLVALAVLGPFLWLYERRRKRRAQAARRPRP